jgi:AraC-like DNA-binding protein
MRQSIDATCQTECVALSAYVHTAPHAPAKPFGVLPTATGLITRLAYARARESGIAPGPLLKKAGLTEQQIDDRGVRLKVHQQIRFLNLVAEAIEDECLGFHLALAIDLRELGFLYYVAASSDDLERAVQRTARYGSMVNEGLSLRSLEGGETGIAMGYVGVSRHLDRQQMEFCLTFLVRLVRHLTGVQLAPTRVTLRHGRSDQSSELSAFLGCNIDFAQSADEIAFAAAARTIPLVSADRYLNELLIANFEEALSRRPTVRGSLRTAVENAVVPLLPHGKARVGEIARQLGLSERTLARRLVAEGLTYSEILESLRRELARQYLADPGLSISQVAWLLGYEETSAFTHAFKRWMGMTPREARAL